MNCRGWLAFIVLSIAWGIPYLLIKVAVGEIASAHVAWCDVALDAAVVLPLAAKRGELGGLGGRWRAISALALLQLALPSLLIAASERWIRSSMAGALAATVPLLVVLLAPSFAVREQLGMRRTVGLLMGFAGVVVLLGLDAPEDFYAWAGIACMLAAALAYAIAPLIIERHLKGRQDLGSAAASLALAAVFLSPEAIWSMPSRLPSLAALGSLVVLGTVSTGLGLALYFFLIREAGAARASLVTYFKPAVVAVLGALVLHEPLRASDLAKCTHELRQRSPSIAPRAGPTTSARTRH